MLPALGYNATTFGIRISGLGIVPSLPTLLSLPQFSPNLVASNLFGAVLWQPATSTSQRWSWPRGVHLEEWPSQCLTNKLSHWRLANYLQCFFLIQRTTGDRADKWLDNQPRQIRLRTFFDEMSVFEIRVQNLHFMFFKVNRGSFENVSSLFTKFLFKNGTGMNWVTKF